MEKQTISQFRSHTCSIKVSIICCRNPIGCLRWDCMNDGKYYVLNWCACSDAKLFGAIMFTESYRKGTSFWGSKLEIIADKFDWILGENDGNWKIRAFPMCHILEGFMCLKPKSVINWNGKNEQKSFLFGSRNM